MANNKAFKIKNGLSAGRYLQGAGTETAGSEGYNVADASYDSVSFSVASQDTIPRGIAFNDDGTKLYMVGSGNDAVHQYSLSTAYDISTASYDSVNLSVSAQDANPLSLSLNNDGTKMYIMGLSTGNVYQYSFSTAYDLSTASYDSVSFSVSTQDGTPYSSTFNGDGTKMYMIGANSDNIHQYSLSTAFDISTASYDSVTFSVTSEDTTPFTVKFYLNGAKMYVVGASDKVHQYSLSTAYDISTASYDNVNFDFTSQDTTPFTIEFKPDGTKMYMIGLGTDAVYQYSTVSYTQTLDLSTGTYFSFTPSGATTVSFTNPPASGLAVGFAVEIIGDGSAITWPSSVKWHLGTAPTATASKEVYTFITTDGGNTYIGKLAGSNIA